MKIPLLSILLSFACVGNAIALDRVIRLEGPIQTIETDPVPGKVLYRINDQREGTYTVRVPQDEANKISMVIKRSPQSVIRFDGTVTDNEGTRNFDASNWKTVEETTTITSDRGDRRIIEKKTTTIIK